MKRLSRIQLLVCFGLLLVLTGNFVPIRAPVLSIQYTYDIGSGDSSSDSVDILLNIFYGESVSVSVEFDSSATPDDCWVWALVNYQYPTKGISETAVRLEGEREVSFIFGWENIRLIPVFVTGFTIRIFYLSTESVSVDVLITRLGNLATLTGLGLIVVLTAIILKPFIINRFSKKKYLESGKTENGRDGRI